MVEAQSQVGLVAPVQGLEEKAAQEPWSVAPLSPVREAQEAHPASEVRPMPWEAEAVALEQ